MDTDLIPARWVGTLAEHPTQGMLVPGETVVPVPRDEADASDNWQPEPDPAAAKTAKKGS